MRTRLFDLKFGGALAACAIAALILATACQVGAAKKPPGSRRVGKPLEIKFTALDDRGVDLAKLGGKVVLIDFWATWCGPCVAEVPHVKAVYDKLHEQGFEIVGISFDEKKAALQSFVVKEKMTWPQYFDGRGWDNKFGSKFDIEMIPTMWLVDKKGVLRYVDATEDLEGKVQKLLAE